MNIMHISKDLPNVFIETERTFIPRVPMGIRYRIFTLYHHSINQHKIQEV